MLFAHVKTDEYFFDVLSLFLDVFLKRAHGVNQTKLLNEIFQIRFADRRRRHDVGALQVEALRKERLHAIFGPELQILQTSAQSNFGR